MRTQEFILWLNTKPIAKRSNKYCLKSWYRHRFYEYCMLEKMLYEASKNHPRRWWQKVIGFVNAVLFHQVTL